MRFTTIAFIALLLSCTLHCEDYPSGVKQYAYRMVPQGTGFMIENFTFENKSAYAVVSGNEIYSIFLPNPPFFMPAPVTDSSRLSSALRAYYISKGETDDILPVFSQLHQNMQALRSTHLSGEAKCRILIGTDRNNCTSFETCQQACYSVTSFCMIVALGAGRDFVNTIWDFENDSIDIGTAYANENAAFSALSANVTRKSAERYLSSIEDLYVSAEDAAGSQLYYGYSYCFPPDYSMGNLTLQKAAAYKAWKSALKFYDMGNESGKILNRTNEGIARKQMYEIKKVASDALQYRQMSEAEFNQRLAEQTFVPRVYICISLAIPVFVFAAIVYYIVRTKTKRQDANAKSSVAGKAKGHDAGINAPDIADKAKSQPGIVDKAKGHDAGIKAPDIADKAKSQPGIVDKAKRQDANAKSSVAGKAKHPDGGAKASKGADKT